MTTHLGVMILFAACVAVVFGALLRDDLQAGLKLAAGIFTSLVFGAYAIGWLLFLAFG